MSWHYAVENEARGPVSIEELRDLVARGVVPPDALVWRPGMEAWTPARDVAELRLAPHAAPRPTPSAPSPPPPPPPAPRPADAGALLRRPWPVTFIAVWWAFSGLLMFLGAAASLAGLVVAASEARFEDSLPGLAWAAVFAVVGACRLGAALGLLRRRPWGRTLGIVAAAFGLFNIPFGTVISILALIYLLQPGMRALCSGKEPGELDGADVAALQRLHASPLGAVTVALLAAGVAFGLLIIPAIAIPNLLNAIQRGKQKRTMSDLRTLATAVEQYSIDHDAYPVPADDWVEAEALVEVLAPGPGVRLPTHDGWNGAFLYRSDGSSYALVSRAKDGRPSGPESGSFTDFRHDIVFSTGSFVTWPEGTQQ